MPESDGKCLNCKASLAGEYCSHCGQAKSARLVPLRDWIGDLLGAFIELDSALLRTLFRLFVSPGLATLDFAEGRRVSYVGPARTYILVSAVSIAAMTFAGVFSANNKTFYLDADVSEEFQERLQLLFPFVNLLSPFLTAALMAIMHRRQFFQKHLAFSLHFWTFQIALTTPLIFLPPTSIWMLLGFVGVSVAVTWYAYVAHRRVYPMSTTRRIFSCFVLLCSIPLAGILFTIFLLALSSLW